MATERRSLKREQFGAQAIVDVVGEIGDVVGDGGDFALQRGIFAEA